MYLLTILPLLSLPLTLAKPPANYLLPSLTNTSVQVDTKPGCSALDRPYIPSQNSTTYEWWYFDAVSSDGLSSVVLIPFSGPIVGRHYPQFLLQIVTPEGEIFHTITEYGPNGRMYVSTKGDGSSGIIGEGDFTWIGEPDLGRYDLKVDLKEHNVSGSVTLISASKPFLLCDTLGPEASTQSFWFLDWINLIGDAVAIVDLKVGDQRVAFTGNGYHDKNWGPVHFNQHIHHWYWGHARASLFSVVWYKMVTNANETKSGAWIAKDGEEVISACVEDTSVDIVPFGNNVTIPPNRANDTDDIDGFTISVQQGGEEYMFRFEEKVWTPGYGGTYARWIGNFTGGKVGEEEGWGSGVGVTEQMGPFGGLVL
ncbi:hypothetical protein I302_103410 [Kwoniella bestiolae CBS 10118]|uniref:AttH domain-containing protein n=1 Tax=Kwoniella bestiolae CBS 10118 TaxID=1296100 RepID=A0AAJ8K5Z6_9TREE